MFFASPKKSTQKKGDPQSATPSRCEGVNLHRVGCGVRRGTHCAAVQLRSDIHGESEHEARALRRACHPATAPTQAQPAGGGQPNIQTTEQPDIHSGHCCARPRLRSARRLRPRSGGRAKQWPVWMFCPPCPSGCAEERRVWRIRARVCLSDAQRRELSETSSNPSTAGCPVASAQGTQTVGSPFLWFLSFCDAKERDSHAGRHPASALNEGMPFDAHKPPRLSAQTRRIKPSISAGNLQPRSDGDHCKNHSYKGMKH